MKLLPLHELPRFLHILYFQIEMKQFLIPQNLCDLEKDEGDRFTVHQLIDLESCDVDNCTEFLNSEHFHFISF